MLNSFQKLKDSLAKTKASLLGKISNVVSRRKLSEELLEEIEEILIEADLGIKATTRLIDSVRERAAELKVTDGEDVIGLIKEAIQHILAGDNSTNSESDGQLEVWIVVGVNGVGKTTTIGKLATYFSGHGKKVIVAACDTFRAAAIDQISIWAERSNVEVIRSQEGADPASVAFDAAKAAKARGADILLVDTAGRLHTKSNLMEELKKIRRVIEKAVEGSTILSKMIIDGSTGQNALNQVRVFTDAVGCDGLIVTKLDGTAKGGVLLAIAEELNVPVDFIGIGEGIDDIRKFDPVEFAEALFPS